MLRNTETFVEAGQEMDGLITVLMLTDICSDEVLFYAFGEDEFIVDDIDLEYGVILVQFIFLRSYESLQNLNIADAATTEIKHYRRNCQNSFRIGDIKLRLKHCVV